MVSSGNYSVSSNSSVTRRSVDNDDRTEHSMALLADNPTHDVSTNIISPAPELATSRFASAACDGMRGATRGVLSLPAFMAQALTGTANFLAEGTTDVLFQVAKKGGLQELAQKTTNLTAIMKHNFDHEMSELENKPYGRMLLQDAKEDFTQASHRIAGSNHTFDTTKTKQVTITTPLSLNRAHANPEDLINFEAIPVTLETGTIQGSQEGAKNRCLHFVKHAFLGTLDITRAAIRGSLALAIFGIQAGKGIATFLIASTIDISFSVIKKGGLQELVEGRSNIADIADIADIVTNNFDRVMKQIIDKPYARILLRDALHDFYQFKTNMLSSVAVGSPPEDELNRSRHGGRELAFLLPKEDAASHSQHHTAVSQGNEEEVRVPDQQQPLRVSLASNLVSEREQKKAALQRSDNDEDRPFDEEDSRSSNLSTYAAILEESPPATSAMPTD